jgi:ABC-type glycerol-3-phosphate transport system permease component
MRSISSERFQTWLFSALLHLLLVGLALLILFPFYWMATGSTLSLTDLNKFPPPLWFGNQLITNVTLVLQRGFVQALTNSLYLAIIRTLLQTFLCALAGFAFAKYQFPGRDKLFAIVLGTMMIPSAVSLVPWYIMMTNFFGWRDSYNALIIPNLINAFGIFWMRQYIQQAVPDELLHAGRIDGCSDLRLFWNIALPIIGPGLGALALSAFLGAWNEWLGPLLILTSSKKYTLAMLVANLGSQDVMNVRVTLSAMAAIPTLVVFFMASRRLIAGLTAGAIKGF